MPVGSPGERASHLVALDAARDRHRDAGRRGHLGGHHLRAHPARAERRGRHPDLVALERLEVGHLLDQPRRRVGARVRRVEAAGVGEQHEPVGADQDRHLGGQEVVVAERDLVRGGRVVLVDHRHHPPVEQLAQGVPRVEVVRARGHVEERQQHLRRLDPARLEQLVVVAVELALPDRRRRLQLLHRARPHRQLHQPHAARDRAGRHDDHVVAGVVARGDLVAERRQHVGAHLAGVVGDDARAELDDHGRHQPEDAARPASSGRPPWRARTRAGCAGRRWRSSRAPCARRRRPRRARSTPASASGR